MNITPEQLKDYTIYQIGALKGFADTFGMQIQHVKPHGALYLMLRHDEELSKAVVEAIQAIDDKLILFSWKNSAIYDVAMRAGLKVINEFFADRGCEEDEKIVFEYDINNIGGSVEAAVERTIRVVKEGKVVAHTGKEIKIDIDTIAAHGDAPIATELARGLVKALKENGVELASAATFL